jgi:hypothetical protein
MVEPLKHAARIEVDDQAIRIIGSKMSCKQANRSRTEMFVVL